MNIATAYSVKGNAKEAVLEIRDMLKDMEPKMVVFFASSVFESSQLVEEMQSAFAKAVVFGCSTAGEIVSGKMLKNSIIAMAFNSEIINNIRVEVVENPSDADKVSNALNSFEKYYGEPISDMDVRKYVGITLVDGLSGAEEKLMDRIGDKTNVTFLGGSAGDDLKFSSTKVYANGKAYNNAAVLALLEPKVHFSIIKTQSFCSLGKRLIATKVNEAKREVVEFNNKPAAVAYSEALNVTVEDAHNYFMHNPVGLMAGDEPYVRSPQQIQGNRMIFYCNIMEGMDLDVLKSTDIVADTKKAVEDKIREMGHISGIINFHCILRTLELEKNGQTEAYGRIFSDIPTIGFSTYGEQYIGHINQTSTMLAFG